MSSSLSPPGGNVDDGIFDDVPTTSSSLSSSRIVTPSSRITPGSPKPRFLIDPLQTGSPGDNPPASGPSASAIMTLDDYKRLNRRTQEIGMLSGIGGGGVLTYAIRQYAPKRPSKNVSSTCISYFTSHTLIARELGQIRAQAAYRALPQAPDGGGVILPDTSAAGDAPLSELLTTVDKPSSGSGAVVEELERLGKRKDRTRWAKGQGLDGEVEEEKEMRDTWFRPGVPRREV